MYINLLYSAYLILLECRAISETLIARGCGCRLEASLLQVRIQLKICINFKTYNCNFSTGYYFFYKLPMKDLTNKPNYVMRDTPEEMKEKRKEIEKKIESNSAASAAVIITFSIQLPINLFLFARSYIPLLDFRSAFPRCSHCWKGC